MAAPRKRKSENPVATPVRYTAELALTICERMAHGESLRAICKSEGMPPESTVRTWAIDDREGFAAQYARAREAQMDALAEELIDIADDVGKTDEDVQRSRLRVDTRKWLMSKIAPKRYGDKITNEITGKDGEPLVRANELAESLIAHVVAAKSQQG
jgi:hypothetical protein